MSERIKGYMRLLLDFDYSYRVKYIGLLASFFLTSKGKSFNTATFFSSWFKFFSSILLDVEEDLLRVLGSAFEVSPIFHLLICLTR